jgi:hypothetical protein
MLEYAILEDVVISILISGNLSKDKELLDKNNLFKSILSNEKLNFRHTSIYWDNFATTENNDYILMLECWIDNFNQINNMNVNPPIVKYAAIFSDEVNILTQNLAKSLKNVLDNYKPEEIIYSDKTIIYP